MADEPDHDIFISFSSLDSAKADSVRERLEAEGFRCWISSRDVKPGENFQAVIVQAIKSAKIMVLIFSANANSSTEISKELALASAFKVNVIPLRTVDVLPQGAFLYELATRQWIDAFKGWDAALDNLTQTARRTLRAPGDLAAVTTPPERLEPKAAFSPAPRFKISEAEMEAARATMSRYVGPIAKVLVRKAANTAGSVEDFRERLIADLPAEERTDCLAQLRRATHAASH